MKQIYIFFFLLTCLLCQGEDFSFEVDGMHFTRISDEYPTQVALMQPMVSSVSHEYDLDYQYPLTDGDFYAPQTIEYEGTVYTVKALWGCVGQTAMQRLILPSSYTTVTNVSQCNNLTELSAENINALISVSHLPALETLDINSDGDVTIESSCISNVGLEEWTAPECVNIINFFSLKDCPDLRYLDLSKVNDIQYYSVYCLPSLETLILPQNIASLWCVCDYFPSLKTLVLPGASNGYDQTYIVNCLQNCAPQKIYCPSAVPPMIIDSEMIIGAPQPGIPELPQGAPLAYSGDKPTYVGFKGGIDLQTCVVYVPQGCADVYRSHPSWQMFANIVEFDFEQASIEEIARGNFCEDAPLSAEVAEGAILLNGSAAGVTVYNINGQTVTNRHLLPGIYLAARGGRSVKVAVK